MFIQYCCNCHYYKSILKIGRLTGIGFFQSSNNRYRHWKIIIGRPLLGTPVFGEFLPFFSEDSLKLCQVGWGESVHSNFQVSPEMFDRIQAVAHSCRFMLYNIRRVRPCLTQEAAQVLIQALVISRLDYCNSLAGLPACAIKPLQLIQNAAARLVFNLPKFSNIIIIIYAI